MPRVGFPMPNSQVPVSGPVGVPDTLTFAAAGAGTVQISNDYALEQMQGTIDFIQAIYINNRANGNPVLIRFGGLSYEIQCRANRQGIWPILMPQGILALTASMTFAGAGNASVPIILFNCQQPYFVWDV